MTNRVKVINAIKYIATYFHNSDGLPDYRLDSGDFGEAADKILSELQLKDEPQPQLNKPDVSGWQDFKDVKPKAGQTVLVKAPKSKQLLIWKHKAADNKKAELNGWRWYPVPA